MTIYTFGYGNRLINTLIDLIEKNNIKLVVDVRLRPYTAWNTMWYPNYLSKHLNCEYKHYKQLGNTGHTAKWIPVNVEAADIILKSLPRVDLLLLCAEKDYIKCHRTEIANRLSELNKVEVVHL